MKEQTKTIEERVLALELEVELIQRQLVELIDALVEKKLIPRPQLKKKGGKSK